MDTTQKKMYTDFLTVALCIIAVYMVLWSFTGMWPWTSNPYNSYSLQSSRWLSGHLDLGKNYSHLEIAEYGGKFFVSFPPFPSFIMLPFTMIFGTKTPDGWIALAVSLIGALYTVKLLYHFKKAGASCVFWSLFLYVGTNLLFVSINGWVWFIAQNICFTLSMMCIYYAVAGKGGLCLAFWACSIGCRPMQILYIPVLLYIIKTCYPNQTIIQLIRSKWHWIITPCVIAGVYMILNFARFGSIIEFGHNYLPEFQEATLGQFNIEYIKDNFASLWKIPEMSNGTVQYPKFNGMAMYIVSPIFISYAIYFVRCIIKKEFHWTYAVLPCLIFVHLLCITAHKTMGGYQFGNRYTNDVLPFIFLGLLTMSPNNTDIPRYHYPLCILGICINIVGSIAVYNNWI